MQSSSGFFSLYGASPLDVAVQFNGNAKDLSKSLAKLSWATDARRREEPPSEIFLRENFCLTSLPEHAKYVLTVSEFEGSEKYQFSGKYSEKKFSAHRVVLEARIQLASA